MWTTATSRILHARETARADSRAHSWIWPLPRLDGETPRCLDPTSNVPTDIEIGYSSRVSSANPVPVFAAQDGILTYAATANAYRVVCIDHAGGWSTQYSGLEHLLVRPTDRFRRRRKERVQAGDIIGHASRSTLRIRFMLTRLTDEASAVIEPRTTMQGWTLQPWFDDAFDSHRRLGDR